MPGSKSNTHVNALSRDGPEAFIFRLFWRILFTSLEAKSAGVRAFLYIPFIVSLSLSLDESRYD